eukprot:6201786-Pleurochrysis_carterae.AAC.5
MRVTYHKALASTAANVKTAALGWWAGENYNQRTSQLSATTCAPVGGCARQSRSLGTMHITYEKTLVCMSICVCGYALWAGSAVSASPITRASKAR